MGDPVDRERPLSIQKLGLRYNFLYNASLMALTLKPLKFLGSSLDDLRAMPKAVQHAIGVELMVVQLGGEPSDF